MKHPVPVELQPVESSNVAAIGHHAGSNTLYIRFQNGGMYQGPCSGKEFEALAKADSIGGHFHKHLRPKGFTKVEE